jgi:hypothetical protein
MLKFSGMPPLNTPGQQQMRYQPGNAVPSAVRRPFVPTPGGLPPNAQPQPMNAGQFGARPQHPNKKRRRFADRIVLPEVNFVIGF